MDNQEEIFMGEKRSPTKSLTQEITEVFDRFAQQELGNRLSEFSLLSFREIVVGKIREAENRGDKIED